MAKKKSKRVSPQDLLEVRRLLEALPPRDRLNALREAIIELSFEFRDSLNGQNQEQFETLNEAVHALNHAEESGAFESTGKLK